MDSMNDTSFAQVTVLGYFWLIERSVKLLERQRMEVCGVLHKKVKNHVQKGRTVELAKGKKGQKRIEGGDGIGCLFDIGSPAGWLKAQGGWRGARETGKWDKSQHQGTTKDQPTAAFCMFQVLLFPIQLIFLLLLTQRN